MIGATSAAYVTRPTSTGCFPSISSRAATISGAAGRIRGTLPLPAPAAVLASTRSIRQPATGRRGDRDGAICQDRVERITHVMGGRGVLTRPLAVLVVDRPPGTQPRLAVDDNGLTGPLDEELVGHTVPRVLEHGEINPMRPRMLGHLLGRLAFIRVHPEEDDPLVLIGMVHFHQAGDVELSDRAVGPQEDENDGSRTAEAVESNRFARGVLQAEVGHAPADPPIDRGLGRGREACYGDQEQQQTASGDTACLAIVHELVPSSTGTSSM